jgi:hypothetical protein
MVDEVLSTCNVSQHHQDWLIEYGAFHHGCLHINWFSTSQTIVDSVVFMGKDKFIVTLLRLVASRLKCMMVL